MKNTINKFDWKKASLLALVITGGVVATAVYAQQQYTGAVEQQYQLGKQFAKDTWEIAYMQGQNDGYQAKEDEQWDKLSTNPELVELLRKYFPDYNTARVIRAIASAESAGKGFAINQNDNGTLDCGWLQNNSVHKMATETSKEYCTRMHDLEENIKQARATYDKQGFEAWVTYKTGAYKKYLPN